MPRSANPVAASQSTNAGNVGIGTGGPVRKLDVRGRGFFSEVIGIGDSAGTQKGYLTYLGAGNSPAIFRLEVEDTADDFSIRNRNASNAMTDRIFLQNTTGNVGIGTTAPEEKLHVAGNIMQSQNSYLRLSGSSHTGP